MGTSKQAQSSDSVTPLVVEQRLFAQKIDVPREYTRAHNRPHHYVERPIDDNKRFAYGTSGFRTVDEFMPFIAYRAGVFAGYRARLLGKNIGIMVTASHNPHGDNGVKLVDPAGDMLDARLEIQLTRLINMSDREFAAEIGRMEAAVEKVPANSEARVHLGWDTRQSSAYLALAAGHGAAQTGAKYFPHNLLTTPQLHYLVRAYNDYEYGPRDSPLARFVEAVLLFREYLPEHRVHNYDSTVYVDCANGVGSEWLSRYAEQIGVDKIDLKTLNYDIRDHAHLNYKCGADHVKIEQTMPINFEGLVTPGQRCASLDGDADRLIYFYQTSREPHVLRLLDGDHIAALFSKFVVEHMRALKLTDDFSFGVVQTAYANGASFRYFERTLNAKSVIAKTGIQRLYQAALRFDVGCYFESNGHGTVWFSERFRTRLRKMRERTPKDATLGRFYAFTRIINECVGDAIADLLAVEQLLYFYDWSPEMWREQTFLPTPTVQLKVPVDNREAYECAPDCEMRLVRPDGLQICINTIIHKYPEARAFVRPSGTENILRIYAEAATDADARELGEELQQLVTDWKLPPPKKTQK